MTDTEITALAREYAEEIHADAMQYFPQPLPDSMEVVVKKDQEEAERLIRFLLLRYCFVEKNEIKEEYERIRAIAVKVPSPSLLGTVSIACLATIKNIFPGLGKEEKS